MTLPTYLKPSKWLPSLALFSVVFIAANMWSTRNHPQGLAPSFQISDLEGISHSFEFNNNTQPVLLHFFATWCPICKLENDTLNSLAKDYRLIVVAMQSGDVDNIKAYQKKHALTMPLYNDETGKISKLFIVTGVPTSFIIDSDGNITSSTIGYASELGLRFRLWLSQF